MLKMLAISAALAFTLSSSFATASGTGIAGGSATAGSSSASGSSAAASGSGSSGGPAKGSGAAKGNAPAKAGAPATAAGPATANVAATASGASAAAEIAVGRFSASDLSGWRDKPYKGKTVYTLEEGSLKAHALKAASGKIRELKVDVKKYPRLTWSWRVDHTLKHEDIKTKAGDDFAARIYVVFPRTIFWKTRAINYVWAAKMPRESEMPSPYTKNSVIVAVESGDENAGKWLSEERNVYEDYKRIFGEEPPQLGGIAIMTDTDDTLEEATAWYGDITLHAPKGGGKP